MAFWVQNGYKHSSCLPGDHVANLELCSLPQPSITREHLRAYCQPRKKIRIQSVVSTK